MKKNYFAFATFLLSLFFSTFFVCAEDIKPFYLENKIPVYVKNVKDSEFISLYLVFKGGTRYLSPETSGLEETCFNQLSMGSKNYSFDSLKSFSYEYHSGFTGFCVEEGSVFGMECISRYFDETFNRYEDAYFNPLFSKKEFDIKKTDLRQRVQMIQNDPESMIYSSIGQVLYDRHPFAAKVSVTPESIENITLEAIKNYYSNLLDSRRISFVAAGNVDSEKLLALLNRSFGKIQSGKIRLKETYVPPLKIKGEPVILVSPSSAGAALIARTFPSPVVNDPEYAASRIAAEVFSDIMYNVVREKNGICYTPFSSVGSSLAPHGTDFLYLATNLTDFARAMNESRQILSEGKTISSIDSSGNYIYEPLEKRLSGYINSYITAKYKPQATVGGISSRMAASLLQFGDVVSGDKITENVKKLTADDVVRVFKKYWMSDDFRWFAVVGPGDEEKISFEE